MKFKDLTGLKFNKWNVIGQRKFENKKSYWLCRCDCGTTKYVESDSLISGKTKGCLKCKTFYSSHNLSNSKLYSVWRGMKNRCYLPNNCAYKNYGGRGINVCDEWKNDFMSFYNWAILNGYTEEISEKKFNKISLDRIDNNGNYSPQNCRWITFKENQNNKRTNRNITYNGETNNLEQWSKKIGIKSNSLHDRIKRHGINVALSLNGNMRGKKI